MDITIFGSAPNHGAYTFGITIKAALKRDRHFTKLIDCVLLHTHEATERAD